jgi:hypothetical protein
VGRGLGRPCMEAVGFIWALVRFGKRGSEEIRTERFHACMFFSGIERSAPLDVVHRAGPVTTHGSPFFSLPLVRCAAPPRTRARGLKRTTPSIPVLKAQFVNHAIPKYPHLLGILVFKVFN